MGWTSYSVQASWARIEIGLRSVHGHGLEIRPTIDAADRLARILATAG